MCMYMHTSRAHARVRVRDYAHAHAHAHAREHMPMSTPLRSYEFTLKGSTLQRSCQSRHQRSAPGVRREGRLKRGASVAPSVCREGSLKVW